MADLCSSPHSGAMLTLDAALTELKAAIAPIDGVETVALTDALGRVLAHPVYSPIDIPYDRNSAMDGYAFASAERTDAAGFTLRLAGVSWAGQPYHGAWASGQCVRIFTGACVPDEADSVVMQEQTVVDGDSVHFSADAPLRQNIRAAGEDVRQGELLCAAPKKLAAIDLGLLAAAGYSEIVVKRRLKIIFFSTGNELLALHEPPQTGKIYDSNRYLLRGLLADACHEVIDGGVIADDPTQLEQSFRTAAAHYDVIITTGGASVGAADYIKQALTQCGVIRFWKIAIKPGKPFAFGAIGDSRFFGLPGNPVAVAVTFQQLVAPALDWLAGAPASKPLRLQAICTSPLKKSPGRMEFQSGILTPDGQGGFSVASAGQQGSHIMSTMQKANCYIVLPAHCADVAVGEPVIVEPFGNTL